MQSVFQVVDGIGDIVGPVHHLRLQAARPVRAPSRIQPKTRRRRRRRRISPVVGRAGRPRVLEGRVERGPGQVQARPGRPSSRGGSAAAGSGRCPRTRRSRPRAAASAISPLWPNGGWPRSWARHAASTRSGSQPSAAPSSRPICAHSRECVSRVRGKSACPDPDDLGLRPRAGAAPSCAGPEPGRVRTGSARRGRLAGSGSSFAVSGRRSLGCVSGCRCPPASRTRRAAGLQPRDRHPERRAGDVVEPDLVEEVDRLRVAAVLAADAELEVRAGSRGPPRRRCWTSAPTPSRVERLERGDAEDALLEVGGEERRLDVVAARSPRSSGSGRWCRRRRTRRPRRSGRRSARRAAARSSCRSAMSTSTPVSAATSASTCSASSRTISSSCTAPTSGIMISGSRVAAGA